MRETAVSASNMFGQALYQQRARAALPILVRQAHSRKPIFYKDLANELGMPNPRNLNYVLGSIGTTLNEISDSHYLEDIPHIQSLVINQHKQLPGDGFDGFLSTRLKKYQSLSLEQKRSYLGGYWQDIYAYPLWFDVLKACNLKPAQDSVQEVISNAAKGKTGGGGEGDEHRKLKEYVAKNPSKVDLPAAFKPGKTEVGLPSGDRVDILFETPKQQVAVEIKSYISSNEDLIRGLFQCVKYQAVLEAKRGFDMTQNTVETVLVIGCHLPKCLYPLKNSLGVKVIEITDFK